MKNKFYKNMSKLEKKYFKVRNTKPKNFIEANEVIYNSVKNIDGFYINMIKNNQKYLINKKNYQVALFPGIWQQLDDDKRVKVILDAYDDIHSKFGLKDNSKFIFINEDGISLGISFYFAEKALIYTSLNNIIDELPYGGLFVYSLIAHELNHQKQNEKTNKIFAKNKYNSADFKDKQNCGSNIFRMLGDSPLIEKLMDKNYSEIFKKMNTNDLYSKHGSYVYSTNVAEVDSGRVQVKYFEKCAKNSYEFFGLNYLNDPNISLYLNGIKQIYSTEEHKKNIPDDKFLPKLSNLTYWTFRKYEIEAFAMVRDMNNLEKHSDNTEENNEENISKQMRLYKQYTNHYSQTLNDQESLRLYFNTFVDLLDKRRVPKSFKQNNFNKVNNIVKYVKENENSCKIENIKEEEIEK